LCCADRGETMLLGQIGPDFLNVHDATVVRDGPLRVS
jgi:hypothetical protein